MYRMHMNPAEAVRAHIDLHSQSSIAIHFGLIDNAGESYDAPVNDLLAGRGAHGVETADFVAPHSIFDGGNVGVRRSQLHTLIMADDYDSLTTCGAIDS